MKPELKTRWDSLMGRLGPRKGAFLEFVQWLEQNTAYFIGPASHKYHLNCEEGLVEHSINVAENAVRIKNLLAPDISDESCVICGLLHDLGKAGWPGKPYYLVKEPTPKQKQYGYKAYPPYEHNNGCTPYMAVPDRSIYLILTHGGFKLTPEEAQAIRIHDGQYVDDNASYANKEDRLSLILHYADSWAGFVQEEVVVTFGSNK